ncbi:cellulose binding domain-containing protein [Agromyces sp. MMS24-K17]|uniref:cellulose binding domain-containing protein n=1 Tax=Agromyces sp. MMS24-K17 TaxID=3372850 RepID=UPI003753F8CB
MVVESTATLLTIAFGVLIVLVGIQRSTYAGYTAMTGADASWAMEAVASPPTTCEVNRWAYHTWGTNGIADFNVANRGDTAVPGSWTLEWDWVDDQYTNRGSLAYSVVQEGQHVRYTAYDWAGIAVGAERPGQIDVSTASMSFLIPTNFVLNGKPCAYVPASPTAPESGEPGENVIVPPPAGATLGPIPAPESPAEPVPEPVPESPEDATPGQAPEPQPESAPVPTPQP